MYNLREFPDLWLNCLIHQTYRIRITSIQVKTAISSKPLRASVT